MSERYTKLYSLPENLYAEGSPLVISAGNLLKDSQTGKVLAQLKIKNTCSKAVKAATAVIHALDTAGQPLNGETKREYLDLNVQQGEEFGQKVPIPLPDPSTRAFAVEVSKVIFSDNSVWTGTGASWEPLPAPEGLNDPELAKQLEIKLGGSCAYMPAGHRDLWRCACGVWNRDEKCYACGKEKTAMLGLDMEALKADRDARLAQEKADREAKAATEKAEAEARARRTKKTLAILIPLAAVCAAGIFVVTKIIIPKQKYEQAMTLMEAGQYEEAIFVLESVVGYKDSTAQADDAKTMWAEQERLAREAKAEAERAAAEAKAEAERAAAYQKAESLLRDGYYDAAAVEFMNLGSYKDSEQRYSEIRYTQANDLLATGEYEEAIRIYDGLGTYQDSRQKALEAKYQWANSLLSFGPNANHENVALARELFEELGTFKDAHEQLQLFRHVRIKEKYENGSIKSNTAFVYDEYGRDVTNEEAYDEAGRMIEDKEYTYSYDKSGRLSKKVSKADSRVKYTYTYTIKNGQVTEEKVTYEYYSTYGDIKMHYTKYVYSYKYDEAGRVNWKEKSIDGKKQQYSVLVYDKEGRLIEEKIWKYNQYAKKYDNNASRSWKYTYDGDDLINETYLEGTVWRTRSAYTYGYIYAPKAQVGGE